MLQDFLVCTFSIVVTIVDLYSKCTEALMFENFWQAPSREDTKVDKLILYLEKKVGRL